MEGKSETDGVFVDIPLWRKILVALLALVIGIRAAWLNSFGSWQWTLPIMMAALLFMPRPVAALGRGLRWPLRVVYLLWIALLTVWAKQTMGWVPAVALGLIWLIGPQEKRQLESWSDYFEKPLALISTIVLVFFFVWAWPKDQGWLPLLCILGPFVLLAVEPRGRRDLKKNIFSIGTLLWVGIVSTTSYWIYMQPSLGKAMILLMIFVLWFGNLLYHLSSGGNGATPHTQG